MDEATLPAGPQSDKSQARGGENPVVAPRLLEILVCPISRAVLEYDAARQELISRKLGLAFPIRDGIPIMLPDEARKLQV